MENYFDDLVVNIAQIHEKLQCDGLLANKISLKKNRLKTFIDRLLFKYGIYIKLVDAGFIRGWFNRFNNFWTGVLNGRPLRFHDFFFLYSQYRIKYQSVSLKDYAQGQKILDAYQRPENIYQIFSCNYIFALNPFCYFQFRQYLKPGCNILEYGCGLAPIATSVVTYSQTNYNITIADIRQFTYAFAKWNLKNQGVATRDLKIDELPQFDKKFDVIFLVQTLEHLKNPLGVVENLFKHLNEGGYLIFDFILSEGSGFDTDEAIRDRHLVLNFIKQNYEIINGELAYEKSMKTTVAKKLSNI